MRVVKVNLPEKSILTNEQFDYFDCYQGKLTCSENVSVVDVCKSFFLTAPNWVDKLFYLRNKVVRVFGLKIPKNVKNKTAILAGFKGNKGEQLGLFKILEKRENEIVLGENDKHLNFKVSIFLEELKANNKQITISTIVAFNNWFGKLYFFPVKPFHKLIVPIMLKSILKDLEKNNER